MCVHVCVLRRYKVFIRNFGGKGQKDFRATLTTEAAVRMSNGSMHEGGTKLVNSRCTRVKQDVTVFEFTVPKPGAETPEQAKFRKAAEASLRKRGEEVAAAIRSSKDLNFALINSKKISGWMPTSPRWPYFEANAKKFVASAGYEKGHHLSADNASEVSSRFEEVAEMMEEEMEIEEY
jgi:hypothetical protein